MKPPALHRHLLVPVDGSRASRHVVHHAAGLARQLEARMTVVHVLEEIGVPLVQYGMEPYVELESVGVEVIEAHRDAGRRLLDDVVAEVGGDFRVDGRLVEAGGRRVAEVIVTTADELDADLIVMGTHGHRGLSRVFLGSVADGVIRASDLPVTLIRHHEPDDADEQDADGA